MYIYVYSNIDKKKDEQHEEREREKERKLDELLLKFNVLLLDFHQRLNHE